MRGCAGGSAGLANRFQNMANLQPELLDFSTLKVKPAICIEAGKIASSLMTTDSFLEGPVRQVLKDIAQHCTLPEPTSNEMAWIKNNLSCQVLMTSDKNVYMQCAPDKSQIFINKQVNVLLKGNVSEFQPIFAYLALHDTQLVSSGSFRQSSKKIMSLWTRTI